jgi:hypothetical protein
MRVTGGKPQAAAKMMMCSTAAGTCASWETR